MQCNACTYLVADTSYLHIILLTLSTARINNFGKYPGGSCNGHWPKIIYYAIAILIVDDLHILADNK